MSFYLYMLRCEDGSIYTGTAKDYLKRYEEHLSGKGAKYTKSHKVKKIERVFLCENRSIACILESEIKKLIKNKKMLCYNRFVTKKYKKRKPTDIIRFGKK